ncbi:uncharacterized protein LOC127865617 isoform X6 [Dreissena polymorpha]|uniref:uncharacterized protein LOC127865617 isoform X5 n=1 Tax=Dreissena polymorpha TaxID=45954 RepID=UPI0022650662|nr:uncharacterized protein LOC127865617 isoform X5 [Dreissena polymorpha]XP_052261451.1 uncharacterized protein LOC127865617 isoform X6 [Dreissena polymorpha]
MRTLLLLLLCFVAGERVRATSVTAGPMQIDSMDADVIGDPTIQTCRTYQGMLLCLVATIAKANTIHLALRIRGYTAVQADITASSPGQICVYLVPGTPIQQLCMIHSNVDWTRYTACVDVSVKMNGQMYWDPFGCFQIPNTSSFNLGELFSSDGMVTSAASDDPTCKPGECQICKSYQGSEVCLVATISNADTIHLALVTSGYTLVEGDITASSHNPICVDNVPGTPIQQLCINPSNVDMTSFKVCVDVSIKVNGQVYTVPIGCFQIPKPSLSYLQELFSSDGMVTSSASDDPTCKPGECQICKSYQGSELCLVATITNPDTIHLALVTSGYTLVEGDITASSHNPICVDNVPGTPIQQLCINPSNVDMTNFKACVGVSIKLNGQVYTVPIGCFQIPKPSLSYLQELFSSDGMVTSSASDDPTCKPGECQICKSYQGSELCLVATITNPDTIHLALVTSGYTLVEGDITASSHNPICVDNVPGTPIQQLCINPSNVDMTNFKACVGVSIKLNGQVYTVPIGCFQIPKPSLSYLQELFSSDGMVTSSASDDPTCQPGECQLCKSYRGSELCLVATITNPDTIHLALVTSGYTLVEGDITASSHNPICVDNVPGTPIQQLCINPSNVDMTSFKACVGVSIKLNGQVHTVPIGCFQIPKPSLSYLQELLIDVFRTDTISVDQEDDTFDFAIGDDDGTVDDDPTGVDDGKTICHRGMCKICHHHKNMKACVIAKATKRGMGLGLVVNHHILLKGRLRNDSPICTRHVPRFPAVKSVCLVPSRVDTTKQAACVNVTAEVRDRKFNRSVGCFKIPRDDIDALPELQGLFSSFMHRLVTSDDVSTGSDVINDNKKNDDQTLRFKGH